LPRSIGVAVLSSAIVLLVASPNTSKYSLIALFMFGLFLIFGSTSWDLDMFTNKELKDMKELVKKLKKEIKNKKK